MLRLLIAVLLFLISLLVLFSPPFHFAWYVSVAVSAYTTGFILLSLLLLLWSFFAKKYRLINTLLSFVAMLLFCSIIVRASFIGSKLNQRLTAAFSNSVDSINGFLQPQAFSISRLFKGTGAKQVQPVIYTYAVKDSVDLQLKFFRSVQPGIRPCLVVVHGGAWNSGDFNELPEVDNYYANAGYQVATINYRLAPKFTSPAPVEDVKSAIDYLTRHANELQIDTANFVLTGRSAGGQIVLMAAYTLHNPAIKGVASYYGPTDMLWSYEHPDNPLVLPSQDIQRQFLGGTPQQVRQKYLEASPMNYVSAATVPTLLINGDNDAHIWTIQQYRLAELLNRSKVPNIVLEIPWATHGCEYRLSSASGQLCTYATERFFWAVTH